jgi:hypothetical protein
MRYGFQHSTLEKVENPMYLIFCKFLRIEMSTDPALSLPDKDSLADKEAEIACLNGRAKKLSAYFKRQERPTANVVYSIARALMATAENPGPGNRKLVCSTRTGRPPKSQPCPADAARALATGHAVARIVSHGEPRN